MFYYLFHLIRDKKNDFKIIYLVIQVINKEFPCSGIFHLDIFFNQPIPLNKGIKSNLIGLRNHSYITEYFLKFVLRNCFV